MQILPRTTETIDEPSRFFALPPEIRNVIYDLLRCTTTHTSQSRLLPTIHEITPVGQALLVSHRFADEYQHRIQHNNSLNTLIIESQTLHLFGLDLSRRAKLARKLQVRVNIGRCTRPGHDGACVESLLHGMRCLSQDVQDLADSLPHIEMVELRLKVSCQDLASSDRTNVAPTLSSEFYRSLALDKRIHVLEILRATDGKVLFKWTRGKGIGKMEHLERCPLVKTMPSGLVSACPMSLMST